MRAAQTPLMASYRDQKNHTEKARQPHHRAPRTAPGMRMTASSPGPGPAGSLSALG
ncbi:hypothetical protein GCM10010300_45270 [Streptomyces olivaceoviridis]|nr:hypothetical protein GCM10010300_45270 [Streptomyces olivaceoviridis]